jgi:hypothetical protein
MRISALKNNWQDVSKGTALKFVVLPGGISLFADVTYEGARRRTVLHLIRDLRRTLARLGLDGRVIVNGA